MAAFVRDGTELNIITGILKIGKAMGIATGTVQRVVMEQPRPFDVDVAEAVAPSPHDTTGAP
jgi:hypothetical protein